MLSFFNCCTQRTTASNNKLIPTKTELEMISENSAKYYKNDSDEIYFAVTTKDISKDHLNTLLKPFSPFAETSVLHLWSPNGKTFYVLEKVSEDLVDLQHKIIFSAANNDTFTLIVLRHVALVIKSGIKEYWLGKEDQKLKLLQDFSQNKLHIIDVNENQSRCSPADSIHLSRIDRLLRS